MNEVRKLRYNDFPLHFSIVLTPGFDVDTLKSFGYESVINYHTGLVIKDGIIFDNDINWTGLNGLSAEGNKSLWRTERKW